MNALFQRNILFSLLAVANQPRTIAPGGSAPFTLSALFALATLVPALTAWVRRLHDVGRSGWWIWSPITLGGFNGIKVILHT